MTKKPILKKVGRSAPIEGVYSHPAIDMPEHVARFIDESGGFRIDCTCGRCRRSAASCLCRTVPIAKRILWKLL